MNTCTIRDCTCLVHARGLCTAHYNRWKRAGKPAVFDGGEGLPLGQSQEAKQGPAFLRTINSQAKAERSARIRAREAEARAAMACAVWAICPPVDTETLLRVDHARHRLAWAARYW